MDSSVEITKHDLRLLSIGYYIQGGLCGFYSLMVLGYLGFLGAILAAAEEQTGQGRNAIPPGFIHLLTTILAVVLLLVLAYAACLLLCGIWIKKRRYRMFLLVMAALTCLGIPYGTVLGIFTFVVLQRPTAKQFFEPAGTEGGSSATLPAPNPTA